jgi:hypothetical protein
MSSFLNDFIAMRKSLLKAPAQTAQKKPKTPSEKKMMSPAQNVEESTITRIIEKKPHKREVIEYLQHKANELTEKAMA